MSRAVRDPHHHRRLPMHGDHERCLHPGCSSHHHWPDRLHNPCVHLSRHMPKLHHDSRHRTKHLRHCLHNPNHHHRRARPVKHSHPYCNLIRPDHHRHPVTLGLYLCCHPKPGRHAPGSLHQHKCHPIHLHLHSQRRPIPSRLISHPGCYRYRRWYRHRTSPHQHRRRLQGCRQQVLGCRPGRFPRSRCLHPVNGRRLLSLMTALGLALYGCGISYRPTSAYAHRGSKG